MIITSTAKTTTTTTTKTIIIIIIKIIIIIVIVIVVIMQPHAAMECGTGSSSLDNNNNNNNNNNLQDKYYFDDDNNYRYQPSARPTSLFNSMGQLTQQEGTLQMTTSSNNNNSVANVRERLDALLASTAAAAAAASTGTTSTLLSRDPLDRLDERLKFNSDILQAQRLQDDNHINNNTLRYFPTSISAAATAATTSTTTTTTTTSTSMLAPITSSSSITSNTKLAPTTTIANSNLNGNNNNNSNELIMRQLFDDMRQIEDTVDSIEIPARGRCRVFMAKYGYDPFKQSPNDNPDAELAFNAGDYIMVFDDIDEDGYFVGELMDGRRGYVPSNWLDRLTGEDLLDFQANVLYKQAGIPSGLGLGLGLGIGCVGGGVGDIGIGHSLATGGQNKNISNNGLLNANVLAGMLLDDETLAETGSGSFPPEFYDALISDSMNHSNFQYLLAPEDYHRMNDYVDLDDVNEVDDECLSDYERAEAEQMRRAVPPPQRLLLERQLNKSILIAWLHPQSAKGTIVSYQVYVDGVLKSTVPSGDRTKALLEGVDSNLPHRISVRAIDVQGRYSNDAGCTIVIGQKIPFAPSCVKASHITSDSALISWLPCNSNFHHVVAVNSVEVQTVRPGVYKHLINGLSANTLYRVWVRAKPGKILSIDEKNPKKLESLTTYVDFKTMPKSLPDPPVNVQVEAGPQRRTLLVTWLPLTLNDFGSSNGCAVTGYAVFAGHKKLADIDSPTGDHALLDICDLESLHKKSVTVRTKSGENLSQDSMSCHIPDEYLKINNNTAGHHTTTTSTSGPLRAFGGQAPAQGQHHAHAHQHHTSSSTTNNMSHSPCRQRLMNQQQQQLRGPTGTGSCLPRQLVTSSSGQLARQARPLARSLQNLESDLDSRRSSIPAIEITRETSGSELGVGGVNLNQHHQTTESYSEEEFENSMRFRGHAHRSGRGGSGGAGGRGAQMRHPSRARQSHSVDGITSHNNNNNNRHNVPLSLQQRQFQTTSRLRGGSGATPLGQQQQQQQQQQNNDIIHYFVALFDYDPSTMSPNPNAAAEELAFKEGSIIRVYGGLGEDGFYKGEIDNQIGYVPSNVITEITEPNLLASLYEKHNTNNLTTSFHNQRQVVVVPQPQPQSQVNSQQQQQLPIVDIQQQQQQPQGNGSNNSSAVKRMVALYDYDPQENSPNADTESEIPFKTSDIIFVYGKMDTDGFYMGEVERTKQRGLVPSNFLREEPLISGGKQQQQQQQQSFHQTNNPNVTMQQQQQQPRINQQQQFNQSTINVPMQMQQQQQPINMGATQMQPQQQQQARGSQQQNQMIGNNQVNNNNQQQQQQNISRPNSLSLNAMNNQQQQQQQQQQQMAMNLQNQQQMAMRAGLTQPSAPMMQTQHQQQQPQGNVMGVNQMSGSGGQQFGSAGQAGGQMLNRNVMGGGLMGQSQPQQQQRMNLQQQQQPMGVLSNLLSSGKQIIGAATTPRMPNQPAGFPGPNQQLVTNQQMVTNQQFGGGGGGGGGMAPMQSNHLDNSFARNNNPMMSASNQTTGGLGGGNFQQPNNINDNFQHGASLMDQSQQIPIQQQQQQQPIYNQMGGNFNRAPPPPPPAGAVGMNQMGGDDQGGNILNTVKNMFKL